jgi:hypothetical protein
MRWVGWSEGWVIFNRDYILGSSLSGKYPIALGICMSTSTESRASPPFMLAIALGPAVPTALATVHATTTKDGTTVTRT